MTGGYGRSSGAAAHFGQYHGAGVVTAVGLRLRHRAHRYRLPRGAVFGRTRLPVVSLFSPIGTSRSSVSSSACGKGLWPSE